MLHLGNKNRPLTPELIACIQDLWSKGFSIRQLAYIFNLHKHRVELLVVPEQRQAWLERCLTEYGIPTTVLK